MSYNVSNSFLEEFDYLFHPFLKQRGSALMMATTHEPVVGGVKYIRQASVGDAHFIEKSGGVTEFAPIKYDRRRLEPRPFSCPILLDKVDMVMQGTPDPAALAEDAANSCGKIIDDIIINGIGGPAWSASKGAAVQLPAEQTIPYNDTTYSAAGDATIPQATKDGLSVSKIVKAHEMLTKNHNYGPLVCIGSPYAMATFRSDPRVASTDFNTQPSLATGMNSPYGGISAFVECTRMDSKKSDTTIEYAYVYAINQIKLGIAKELELNTATLGERNFNQGLEYWGMYGCTRMFEEAVVRIEIKRS